MLIPVSTNSEILTQPLFVFTTVPTVLSCATDSKVDFLLCPPFTESRGKSRQHRVYSVPGFLSSLRLGSPNLLMSPSLLWVQGGETHPFAEEGVVDPIPTKGHTLWYSMYAIIIPLR
jgi:hypothetical protein